MVLEHHSPVWPRLINLTPLQDRPTLGGLTKPGNNIQNSGFAAAGMPDNGYKLTLGNFQIDVIKGAKNTATGRKINRYAAQLKKTGIAALGRSD